ncbi:MAG: endonuclease [Flavobacterium sp.]|nr:endonuclease [Flavobacterium sp.]
MIKNAFGALLMLCAFSVHAQVAINEIDADTPSTDELEFIELKSETANFSLDGYVLVLYNGSPTSSTGNKSYFALDLDGLVTDINGIILIGTTLVSPVPDKFISSNTIQNGQDAVALYLGNASDFPDQTPVTATNLVDAIVYGNNNPDATTLMSVLDVTHQVNESMNSLGTVQSIQRKNDGSYEVKEPTPGANNDGSGVTFNGISIVTDVSQINEGDSFQVAFTTQYAVSSDLSFTINLNNSGFNSADYTGNVNIFIPAGGNSVSTTLTIVDDALDEGDELLKIKFGSLPSGYNRLNDAIEIRVIDNDFTTAAWGTPLNPTYGIVSSTAPTGYYDSLEGLSGAALRQALQDIIANPAVVREHTYGDVTDILNQADQNPLNSNEVWLMYVEQGRAKYKFQTVSSSTGLWNREHIYPQSRGGFANATSSTADGINIWDTTGPDDIAAGHSDAHHIRAEDGPENSSRNNRDFGDDYNGPAGTAGSWRGDVARSVFYMVVRYNLLSVVEGNPADNTDYQLGDLNYLLAWNSTDPSDDFEMNRNNIVYTWQHNRNPFIDYPELVDYIWGDNVGQPWHASLSTASFTNDSLILFPNPARDYFAIGGLPDSAQVEIVNVSGMSVSRFETTAETTNSIDLPSGMYFVRITSEEATAVKKLIVK